MLLPGSQALAAGGQHHVKSPACLPVVLWRSVRAFPAANQECCSSARVWGAPPRRTLPLCRASTPAGSSPEGSNSQKNDVSSQSSASGAPQASSPDPSPSGNNAAQGSPWKELSAAMAAIVAFFTSLVEWVKKLPQYNSMVQLGKLRREADEEPKNAEKQAEYLQLLNKRDPREVIARVESREYASNEGVVAEYIKALVATDQLSRYVAPSGASASGSTSSSSSAGSLAAAGAGPSGGDPFLVGSSSSTGLGPGEDHRSLTQLLKDLQLQVSGSQPEETPGASVRRPLHVTVAGAVAAPKPTGPLNAIWKLVKLAMAVVGLSFAFLVGQQALRRMQVPPYLGSSTAAAVANPSSSSNNGLGGGGTPSVDPKEYKKEEMPEKAVRTFKDVRGCDEAKEELKEVVEFLKNPAKFTRLGAKLPKGVLLTGPPGTGKTLLARAVAGEAGVPFFYRAGSEFEELYVGVGSRRMRALFAAAKKKAPCIVFIDEIDAIGGNRKHWENHTRKTLNQLLVEMDGFEANEGVIVMAATNLAETLDPALKRPGRFDRQVAVPLPDIRGRTEILEYYLHDKPVSPAVDKDLLARQTQGFSGADLSNLINEAALLAAKQNAEQITPAMLDHAFDKIRMGVERKSVRRTDEGRRRTAYHEAGHAIVALHTPGASPIHKATIVPRGHALGMVTQVGRDDEFSINRQQMMARIWVCMGGQMAEEVIFGKDQVTSGATDDLRQATSMARYMVTECGFDDTVGPVYVGESGNGASEELKQRIDDRVRGMLVDAREGVRQLLQDKMTDLHALAGALIERETLTAEEISAVLAGESPAGPATPPGGSGGPKDDEGKDQRDPVEGTLLSEGAPASGR